MACPEASEGRLCEEKSPELICKSLIINNSGDFSSKTPFDKLRAGSFDKLRAGSFDKLRAGCRNDTSWLKNKLIVYFVIVPKDLLMDFLNQLLPERHQIKDLTYTRSEHLGVSPLDRKAIFDIIFSNHRNEEQIVHLVELKDQKCEVFYEKLKFIYVELPKFTKTEEELVTHFDKWLYVFRHLSELQDRPVALQERVFKNFLLLRN